MQKFDNNLESLMTSLSSDSDNEDFQTPADLQKVKELSQKLNLTTRRPSVIQWKQAIEDKKLSGLYGAALKNNIEQKYRCLDHLISVKENFSPDDSQEDVSSLLENYTSKLDHEVSENESHVSASPILLSAPSNQSSDESKIDFDNQQFTDNKSHILPIKTEMTSCEKESDRFNKVTQQLQQIQHELILMRMQDNELARCLLDVRQKINLYKAQQSCDEHADMLDDVACELEEEEEMTAMTRLYKACDLSEKPPAFLLTSFTPLRNIGVSKMNLNERRFSIR